MALRQMKQPGVLQPIDRRWLSALVCGAVVVLLATPNFLAPLRPYDSGIAASASTFTLHGLLPYRDYWTLYGPLSGWLLAIPTAVLGQSVALLRVMGLVALGVQAVAGLFITRSWAAAGPAIAIVVASLAMGPVILGLEPSAWSIAMTFALVALALAVQSGRGGLLVGGLAGITFLTRLDVGAYLLLALLLTTDRRATVTAFALVAGPFVALALLTSQPDSLFEQLVWYPLIGPHQFRGLPGPEATVGQPTAAVLSVPLLLLPRAAILLSVARLIGARIRKSPSDGSASALVITAFAALCQLQTLQGRADLEHYAQAATPSILLLAVWYRAPRPSLGRFACLVVAVSVCVVVGLIGWKYVGSTVVSAEDNAIVASSQWVREATTDDEPIFVGLTAHRYTVTNPLLIYYLAGRRSGVRDAMFNPGVTNTDWGQTRMVDDLQRSATRYLVLDRANADRHEETNDSRIPGSITLDTFIAANYHAICDLQSVVIMARNDSGLNASPGCPAMGP